MPEKFMEHEIGPTDEELDAAVAWLTGDGPWWETDERGAKSELGDRDEAISGAWQLNGTPADCLFLFCASAAPFRTAGARRPDGSRVGCLTQVRGSAAIIVAFAADITELVKADDRLPVCVKDVTAESLPVFAEWQRVMRERRRDILRLGGRL